MTQRVPGMHGAPWLALSMIFLAAPLRAEVILESGSGRVVGEAIADENDTHYSLVIYRGYGRKIPRRNVIKQTHVDRSNRDTRTEFDVRRAALGPADVPAALRLAKWAEEQGLVLQARQLLFGLQQRYPEHAAVRSLPPPPPAREKLSAQEREFLQAQVRRFFEEPGSRAAVLAALAGNDILPPDEVRAWAAQCLAEARKGPRLKPGDIAFKGRNYAGKVHIRLWRRTAQEADDQAPWPVLLALHGGGLNSGSWRDGGPLFFGLFREHFDRLLFVAPNVLHRRYAEWGGNPLEEEYVGDLLEAVKRTWRVDTDRVYLAGISMGGYGTWHIGGHRADRFAGLVSSAGGLLIGSAAGSAWGWGTIGNLMHTPIAFLHGGKDKPAPPWSDAEAAGILTQLGKEYPGCYRHQYRFYPKAGHGLPRNAHAKAVRWIVQHKRNPYPKHILWEPKRAFNRTFYWLRVENPELFTRMEARIHGNTVHLSTDTIWGGFSVLLNEHLVDLRQPVTVTANGETIFRQRVPATLATVLQSVADRVDERQWYAARIDF